MHSAAVFLLTQPWPLQLFWPLHWLLAVAQSDEPLQLLMPLQATAAVWGIADEANRFVNRVRPWDLAGADPAGRLDAVLYLLARACAAAGRELAPFLPDAAARVTAQCTPDGDGRLPDPRPVFRRLAPGRAES